MGVNNNGSGQTKADLLLTKVDKLAQQNRTLDAKVEQLARQNQTVVAQIAQQSNSVSAHVARISQVNDAVGKQISQLSAQPHSGVWRIAQYRNPMHVPPPFGKPVVLPCFSSGSGLKKQRLRTPLHTDSIMVCFGNCRGQGICPEL